MNPRREMEGSPLILLVNDEEWTARSLDTVLRPNGYAVLLAYTGEQGLDLAAKVKADCIVIDYGLPDMTGGGLAARMRKLPTVRDSTPVLVISTRTLSRPERLSCLESGAWDVLKLPFDTEEFLIRLDRYLGAKRDADRARDRGHVDPGTGLYNIQGLTRRVTEILADAVRHDHPLACVVLGLSGPAGILERGTGEAPLAEGEGRVAGGEGLGERQAEAIARTIAAVTRVSDVLARVGNDDFVIVAPSTGEEGAQRLADRLFEALGRNTEGLGLSSPAHANLRAGYHALDHPASRDLLPEDLLTGATLALRQAQAEDAGESIRRYNGSEAH